MSQPMTPAEVQALLDGPSMKPPPGRTPNFEDPGTIAPWFVFTTALIFALTALSLAMRLTTRLWPRRQMAPEDYIIIVAWLALLGYYVPSLMTIPHGTGTHLWNVRLHDWIDCLYYINAASCVYGPALALVKVAILLQIERVFVPIRDANKPLFFGCWILIVLIPCFYITTTTFEAELCRPREKIWNVLIVTGHCFSSSKLNMATGIFNIVSDVAIMLLPVPTIYSLQIALKKKLAILSVFAAAVVACVTSALRFYYSFRLTPTSDASWLVALEGIWATCEIGMGIIIFCLPTFPKFYGLARNKVISTVHSSGHVRNDSYASGTVNGDTNHTARASQGKIVVAKGFSTYTEKASPSFNPNVRTLSSQSTTRSTSSTAYLTDHAATRQELELDNL